jgi:prevent-host-death family protein
MTIVISNRRKPHVKRTRERTMAAGVFKANCLVVMEEVRKKRQPVIITKHGKPVAKLVPVESSEDDIFGFMKGEGKILGDVVSPAVPAEEWDCLK